MKYLKRLLVFVLLVTMVCPVNHTTSVGARTAAEARQKKAELEGKKKQAKATIRKYESSINKLFANIQKLDTRLDKLGRRMNKLSTKLNNKRADLKQTRKDLKEAKKLEVAQYDNMKVRIKYMYENGTNAYLTALFSAASFGDIMNQKEYVDQVAEYDATMYQRYQATRRRIQKNEKKLEKEVKEVARLKRTVISQRSVVQDTLNRKNEKMSRYQSHVSKNQALIKSYNKAIRAEERAIQQAEAASTGGGNFTYTGGKLLWPCPASSIITSPFGYRVHPVQGVGRMHDGVDIAVATGNNILAAESGTVIISQYSSSAGNYIMIDHGGGLSTVYMHNSSLLVRVGEHVTRGQVIAYSGSTGWSTGPHLHFGVRLNGQYVNPMTYVQ